MEDVNSIIGKTFGYLTIVDKTNNKYIFKCKCKCGKIVNKYLSKLISGHKKIL